ncbi:unnamed protein product [Mesocestoides corti]|uniref:Transmembrane protein n=1 Tax=Mesocestoides corti TaxID=53468 RepID=A0A0R3UE91_MESCO|nr:unnamed protein product [Mesocestoides corti]
MRVRAHLRSPLISLHCQPSYQRGKKSAAHFLLPLQQSCYCAFQEAQAAVLFDVSNSCERDYLPGKGSGRSAVNFIFFFPLFTNIVPHVLTTTNFAVKTSSGARVTPLSLKIPRTAVLHCAEG